MVKKAVKHKPKNKKQTRTPTIKPVGFLSYAHFDDEHNRGWVSDFRQTLSDEVRAQTGNRFPIFQDRKDIQWGENWRNRVNSAVDAATFFFPVITPHFWGSKECKRELRTFIEHERAQRRPDLIFPVYFIRCKEMEEERRPVSKLVRDVKKHQWKNVTDLRFEPVEDAKVRRLIAEMAVHVCDAIDRVNQKRGQA